MRAQWQGLLRRELATPNGTWFASGSHWLKFILAPQQFQLELRASLLNSEGFHKFRTQHPHKLGEDPTQDPISRQAWQSGH